MQEIIRKFAPGSEWLYIKLYTGIKTADIILEEAVKPLIQKLQNDNLIKKWFFIRYNDPKPHLRIRFELSDLDNFSKVITLIKISLKDFIDSGEIFELVLDTYQREIERYGGITIQDAEFLFWKNSDYILHKYLHFEDEEKIIVSLFYIDTTLQYLGLSVQEKLDWIREFDRAFKLEFKADKRLNTVLGKKYRAFVSKYDEFTDTDEYLPFSEDIITNINNCSDVLQHVLKYYPNPAHIFFQSIFHMNINRMFVSNQRMFEMIIYDYLFRYYKNISFKNDWTKKRLI